MSRTTLRQHKQVGKKLIPPLVQMGMSNSSWQNERLPQMLWATVLVGNLPREDSLNIFRRVAEVCVSLPRDVYPDVSHYGLAQMPLENAKRVISAAAGTDDARGILASILLYEDLPAKDAWWDVLRGARASQPEEVLMKAVGCTLWHQSQEATDCRWCRILPLTLSRRMGMPEKQFLEIVNYPGLGEMTRVRPTIRAEEISIAAFESHVGQSEKRAVWPSAFWTQNLRMSPCFALLREEDVNTKPCTTALRIEEVYSKLTEHNLRTCASTGVDAQHDAIFGIAFYGLCIVRELLAVGNCTSIVGRLGLRTLLECFVTLAYLIQMKNPELWKSWRVFGAGQAKLSSLKLEELNSEKCFADAKILKQIANEDRWEEFLPINVGHWEDSSLRRQAIEADVKAEYDKYYSWASTFAHAHWGSVRECVFDTCGNPLHRLHRVPRPHRKTLQDVLPDACELMDKILDLLSKEYPVFLARTSIAAS